MSEFRINVEKDYIGFCAGHFITYDGHQCETLHGHNYRVGIETTGSVDAECLFVLDFSILKKMVRRQVDEIDHKVLLPTKNPKLQIVDLGLQLRVDYYGEPTYLFPKTDCALLPIENTTAEMLARYLAEQVQCEIKKAGITNLTSLELEVEETFGQSARYRMEL
jgi:6-pyruvoyltetrahydropterin/6-carboxytetrahydropterin synthase